VAAALANGLSRVGAGGFPQIAGIRVTWNPLAPSDQRLGRVEVRQPDGTFAPLDPDRIYRVVTNNFMRTGGDGYAVMRDHAIDPYDSGPGVDEVVATAITRAGTLSPRTDGRIGFR
jgi:5'-nucleotidase